MDTIVTEKKCSHCGEIKPVSSFYMSASRGKPRLASWCKVCFNKKSREYEKRPESRKRKNAQQREKYYNNIDTERERARKNTTRYRETHPIEYYKRQVLWRENNREHFNELQRNH
jgi:hypothetical protein